MYFIRFPVRVAGGFLISEIKGHHLFSGYGECILFVSDFSLLYIFFLFRIILRHLRQCHKNKKKSGKFKGSV